jgi:hypothetical protein
MSVRIQTRLVSDLNTLLREIRDPMTMFCGKEGPVSVAVASAEVRRDPRVGLYTPVREVKCMVATVSSLPHIVTAQGWLAHPLVVNGESQWTADRTSRLYAPISPDKFGEIDSDLLDEIVEKTSLMISRYDDRC